MGDRTFDIDSMDFVEGKKAIEFRYWVKDPFDPNLCWSILRQDTTGFICRLNLSEDRIDSIKTQVNISTSFVAGPSAIWLSDNRKMWWLDKNSGMPLGIKDNPAPESGIDLLPWGDNMLITERWLYLKNEDKFIPFNPLPEDIRECRNEKNTWFVKTGCLAQVQEKSNDSYYLSGPGFPPKLLSGILDHPYVNQLLAVNLPVAWFHIDNRLIAFDMRSGDTLVYHNIPGNLIPGDHQGRFLGFESELGLCFFDKKNRTVRMLNMPFGYKGPGSIFSDNRFIYLTYADHWDIVDFLNLGKIFHVSDVISEYEEFEEEWRRLIQPIPKQDFYAKYDASGKMKRKYGGSINLKIQKAWKTLVWEVANISSLPDSTFQKVAADYWSDCFDSNVYPDLTVNLYNYWFGKGSLFEMNHLIQKPGNRSILETENRLGHINSLSWVVQQKQLLDSLEAQVYMPDERLFRMGKFWFNYYESLGNYAQIEQSFTLLRELIQKYPNSSRVEESEYLLLSFIDNVHFGFSCDRSPRGDYRLAYPALKQFLKDHPSSKKRPEILFRLVNALSWLKSDWRWAVPYLGLKNDLEEWAVAYQILSGEADKNMEILENEFPDFVRTSEECQKTITLRKREVWNNKWELEAVPQFPKFLRTDTIKFDIRILNRSLTAQILDTIFLDYWSWNIRFHFEMEPPSGCERREIGDFSVYHPGKLSRYGPVTVQPGSWYKEAFYVLPQTARLDKPGKYFFSFLYQHPELKWLSVTGKGGTIEIVE